MKYTIQNQHYHLAALTGFFWGEIINEESPRETKLSLIKINKFLDLIYKKDNPNNKNYIFLPWPFKAVITDT